MCSVKIPWLQQITDLWCPIVDHLARDPMHYGEYTLLLHRKMLSPSLCQNTHMPQCRQQGIVQSVWWPQPTGWTTQVRFLAEVSDFSSLKTSRLILWSNQTLTQWVPGFLPRGATATVWSWPLHLVPRFKKSRAIPLLPPYAFMVWTGTASLFTAQLSQVPWCVVKMIPLVFSTLML
jgi:hypothetical protein